MEYEVIIKSVGIKTERENKKIRIVFVVRNDIVQKHQNKEIVFNLSKLSKCNFLDDKLFRIKIIDGKIVKVKKTKYTDNTHTWFNSETYYVPNLIDSVLKP